MTKDIFDLIKKEEQRQLEHIELIASENFVSPEVLSAQGSVLTNKYAEGYPGKRYYGGCQYVDLIEQKTIDLVKKLFNANYANVQPYSGSIANMAVYKALLKPGDKILGMKLTNGGHLTHGHKVNFSGIEYNAESYGVDKNGYIDYADILKHAKKFQPKLIIAGASAYSRKIDFKKFKEIADKVRAYLFVDMAHIAGLVAVNLHQNPIDYADVVTSTTHKTLRGPRGGFILTNNKEIAKKIDNTVFPGIQGGPLMHVIAAKGICFEEALDKDFIKYQKQVLKNTKTLAEELMKKGTKIITEGTDNHLILVDVLSSYNKTGKEAETILENVFITCNKNTIPNDSKGPFITSGIRLGSPAITTRGMKEKEMIKIAIFIDSILKDNSKSNQVFIKEQVKLLTSNFKLYKK